MCGQESNQRLVFLLTCCSNLTVGFHGCVTAFFFFDTKRQQPASIHFYEGTEKMKPCPFQWCLIASTRGTGCKLEQRR